MSRTRRSADGRPHAEALAAAAEAVARSSSLDAALEALLRIATSSAGADTAIAFLEDPDRAAPELVMAVGLDDLKSADEAEAIRRSDHPAVGAARARLASFDRPLPGGGAAADLPLVVARDGIDVPLGGITVASATGGAGGDANRAFLRGIADLAALAVERFRLASLLAERADWLERLAHTDPLTGLANQRTLARILELELARASRQGGEVSVALFDVDDFGSTNETAGPEAGDDMLRAVAAVLGESVRLVDTVARFGGDEFVLVAPGSAGPTVARRVLTGVAALPAIAGRRASVSAGVARFPADGTTADELLAAAGSALARARAAGPGTLAETNVQVRESSSVGPSAD